MNTIHSIFLCSLLFVCLACGGKEDGSIISGGVQGVDQGLTPYVKKFESYLERTGQSHDMSGLSVQFSDTLKLPIIGVCILELQVVEINREMWLRLTADLRELLMFHELGHCVLRRPHNTTLLEGIPESVMYPYLFGEYYARADLYPRYVAELFYETGDLFAGLTFSPEQYASRIFVPLKADETFLCGSEH